MRLSLAPPAALKQLEALYHPQPDEGSRNIPRGVLSLQVDNRPSSTPSSPSTPSSSFLQDSSPIAPSTWRRCPPATPSMSGFPANSSHSTQRSEAPSQASTQWDTPRTSYFSRPRPRPTPRAAGCSVASSRGATPGSSSCWSAPAAPGSPRSVPRGSTHHAHRSSARRRWRHGRQRARRRHS